MKTIVFFTGLICISMQVSAQQIVAGSAQAEKNADTITFYINTYSVFGPNDTCIVAFGDGISYQPEFVSTLLYDSLYINTAMVSHVYPDTGIYRALIKGGYLVDSILNIENSAAQKFNIEIKVNNNPNEGFEADAPPVYAEDIFQMDVNGSCKIAHSEAATDPEDDNIKYKMVGYTVNNGDPSLSTIPGATTSLIFHSNGSFSWNAPLLPGLYAFEFHADTYRDGVFLSNSVRKVLINAPCWGATGIEEIPREDLFVYPNPADEVLHITLPQQFLPGKVRIYTIEGKLVFGTDQFTGEQTISVDAFQPGMYMLCWESSGEMSFATWIKQ
ncbi:MAG: T9SS type A sorting domain-containing protein [Chitinophagales bacterium]